MFVVSGKFIDLDELYMFRNLKDLDELHDYIRYINSFEQFYEVDWAGNATFPNVF